MSELLTVTQEPDKIVVTEEDGVTLVTVIAQGPQGVPGSSILPDASATVKGALKLRNDLGGTSENPTVPGLALKASKTYVDDQVAAEQSEREAADTALQVEIDEKYELPTSGVARTDLDASTRASLTKADTALQVAPVTSVAGKTGAVTVTKADVGLGSADNTSDLAKPLSTATQTALNTKVDKVAGKGLSTNDYTTTEQTKLAGIAPGATQNSADASLRDRTTHTGTQPISTVTGLQTALDGKQPTIGFTPENQANKGAANGYASLDSTSKVPASQLPSYVDDVLEFTNLAAFPGTGDTGKIYVALDTGKLFRWSGSIYVEISPSPGSTDAVPEGSEFVKADESSGC